MCSYLGVVNHYQHIWPKDVHILSQLPVRQANILSNGQDRQIFQKDKAIIVGDCFLGCPNHNKPFCIKINASKY